jgi:hypothetical protein
MVDAPVAMQWAKCDTHLVKQPIAHFASDPQKDNGTDSCSTVSDEDE